jgi:hypothetical protein
MGKSQYVSLQDAALLADKSAQTIRRLLKSNKLRYRKYKTPQGFTYLVEKTSLLTHFGEKETTDVMEETDDMELVEEFDPENEAEEVVVEAIVEPPAGREAPPSQQPAFRINQNRPQANVRVELPPFESPGPKGATNEKVDDSYQVVMTQLIQQHRDDKKRLFELLEIFQKRILTLEDQIKQLEGPKKKRWWRFGK